MKTRSLATCYPELCRAMRTDCRGNHVLHYWYVHPLACCPISNRVRTCQNTLWTGCSPPIIRLENVLTWKIATGEVA